MRNFLLLFLILCGSAESLSAQVSLRTEYIGKSAYKDINNKKNGGRGGAMVYTGSAEIPFSYQPTDDGRMTAWAMSLYSSYTSFSNNDRMKGLSPDKIFNNRVGITYIRPLWKKWSLLTTVGAGIYAPHTNIGKTRFDEVLFDGAVGFIWHLRRVDVGVGVAFNSSFGYPMGFPALFLKWSAEGKYFIDVQVMDGMNLTAGMHLSEWLTISVVADANGSVAMQKHEGKKQMFSHSYITTSFQPEFRIGKHISIPVRAGVTTSRSAYYQERTLRAFFKAFDRDYDPGFQAALYLSAGINYSF